MLLETKLHHIRILLKSLRGNRTDDIITFSERVQGGTKGILVFGHLSLVGAKKTTTPFTYLAETAFKGSSLISLLESVDWRVGDTILIGATDYDPMESETAVLASISADGKTLLLDRMLNHTHTSTPNTFGLEMSAEVALLTRNVVIEGAEDKSGAISMQKFGARIYVSGFSNSNETSIFYGDHYGSAVIDNVEMRNVGQEGYMAFTDYRGGIVFDFGDVGIDSRYSSAVRNSVIHTSFLSGIAVMGVETMFSPYYAPVPVTIENNIVFRTSESSIKILAEGATVANNLALGTRFTFSAYADKDASHFIGTFENLALSTRMFGNRAGGSQSAGFLFVADTCGESSIYDNIAHSNM